MTEEPGVVIVHGCAKSQTQGSDTHTHKSKLKCPKDNLKQDQHAVEKDNHKKKCSWRLNMDSANKFNGCLEDRKSLRTE